MSELVKIRLDALLVQRQLFPSRERAQMAIEQKMVRVNGQIVAKAAHKCAENDLLEVIAQPLRYVSRGGLKLEKAIQAFGVDFSEKTVLDLGASTGGFTDCALQHGARRVFAVDVGSDQLDATLRQDGRVVSYENLNIRDLTLQHLDNQRIDIIVSDLSFVSITAFFPYFQQWLDATEGYAIVLIKPQFELGGRLRVKNGIVKDAKLRRRLVQNVLEKARENGLFPQKMVATDADGLHKNVEYLCLLTRRDNPHWLALLDLVN